LNKKERTVRILLVEDDAALASAVCSYLEAKAFVVDVAPGLTQARAALAAMQYAAVLLDLHLPDGEGLSLLPHVRALRDRPIVIVLTARDQVTDRIRGLDAGADDYLIKPYDPAELLARLRAVEAAAAAPARRCCSWARWRSIWRPNWCARTACRSRSRRRNGRCCA
jgi:DNA-binding response OmpR family regulator